MTINSVTQIVNLSCRDLLHDKYANFLPPFDVTQVKRPPAILSGKVLSVINLFLRETLFYCCIKIYESYLGNFRDNYGLSASLISQSVPNLCESLKFYNNVV